MSLGSMGNLVVTLTASTGQFVLDMGRAAYSAEKNFDRMQAGVKKFSQAYVGAFSVSAIVDFVDRTIDAADALQDLAKKTQTNVAMLAALAPVAEQNGTTLDAMALAAKNLSVQMVKNPEAFRELGITAKDTLTALIQMADVFKTLPDDGIVRVAAARKLLGKTGEDMLPIFQMETRELMRLVEEYKKLNPDIETAAKRSDEFNDQFAILKTSLNGLAVSGITPVLPVLTEFTSGLDKAIQNGRGLATILTGMVTKIGPFAAAKPFADLFTAPKAKQVSEVKIKFQEAEAPNLTSSGKKSALEQLLDDLDPKKDKKPRMKKVVDEYKKFIDELNAEIQRFGMTPEQVKVIEASQLAAANPKMAKQLGEVTEAWIARRKVINDSIEGQEKLTAAMEEANRILNDTDPIRKAGQDWQHLLDIQKAVGKEVLSDDAIAKEYVKMQTGIKETTDFMKSVAEEAAKSIQSAFADFLFDPFSGGLSGMIQGFSNTIRRMVAEAAAAQILQSIGNWGKIASGGGGVGGLIGKAAGWIFGGTKLSFEGGGFTGSGPRVGGIDGKGGFTAIIHPDENIIDQRANGATTGRNGIIQVANYFTIAGPADRRTQEQLAAAAGLGIQRSLKRSS